MKRRTFLGAGAALPALSLLPRIASAQTGQTAFDPRPGAWRSFEITTHVEVVHPGGLARAWIPVPAVETEWQRVGDNGWSGNAASVRLARDGKYGANMVVAEWSAAEKAPVLEVVSRFATRNRAVDFAKRDPSLFLAASDVAFYTAATELQPTDGIVAKTAKEIVKGKRSDIDKARAVYEWVVENSFRDPKTRGCGVGDVKALLETGTIGGKCADLNGLFVALCRAAGIPARDVYGARMAKSEFGYRSLGAGSDNITRAQHCRAEVFLTGYGWVPADPADVRKAVLEEKAQPTTLADPIIPPVRTKLFGAWEGNWFAYNTAHDVVLPGAKGAKVAFLMYPQAETARGRVDPLDPDNFKYRITTREIKA